MNVLILTAKYGMGHYQVSTALKQQLENRNIQIEVVDFFELIFPKACNLIYGSFNLLVSKCSSIYNLFYKFSASSNSAPLNQIIDKRIENLIKEKDANIIISTFPACSKYISAYKKSKKNNLKLYTYITDVDVNKEWITEETDMYFVACYKTKIQLENYNIDSSKIKVTGIPVKQEFKKLQENKTKNEILVMGGGLGFIPCMEKCLKELLQNTDIHITLITGKNQKLFNKYNGKFKNMSVIGYTNSVYKYMEKAELIITKAGGVTLFEAINSKTPIYVVEPFLNQEIGNAKFIENQEIGVVVWKHREFIAKDILNLLESRQKLERMKNNMKRIIEGLENTNIVDVYMEKKAC